MFYITSLAHQRDFEDISLTDSIDTGITCRLSACFFILVSIGSSSAIFPLSMALVLHANYQTYRRFNLIGGFHSYKTIDLQSSLFQWIEIRRGPKTINSIAPGPSGLHRTQQRI